MRHIIYKIETNTNEVHVANGLEFKKLCFEKDWNHSTLYWSSTKHKNNESITRGKHKGFKVNLIDSPCE